jgi:UDP:flavonoid glycosyltransferase YjiC (YdhE family)
LVVTGDRSSANAGERPLPGLPAGCDIRNWIDFDTVMPTLTAIVHHGGVGTTHAALRHGLPQVAVPHAGDQQAQAGRITQAGVGFGVRPVDFTPANARWLVRQLLSNATLHARATAWQNELQALGGTATAAQTLEAAFSQSRFVV